MSRRSMSVSITTSSAGGHFAVDPHLELATAAADWSRAISPAALVGALGGEGIPHRTSGGELVTATSASHA